MKKKLLAFSAVLLLAVAIGNPYSMAWIASRLVVADELEPADAVVTLRSAPELERTRTDEAARLARGEEVRRPGDEDEDEVEVVETEVEDAAEVEGEATEA